MINIVDKIYPNLKEYLTEKSQYSPRILQKAIKQSDKFPLVTIIESDNSNDIVDTNFMESTDNVDLTIDIYTQDKTLENSIISCVSISNELVGLTDYILSKKYRFRRVFCKRTPNLDSSIYRVTMKYTKKVITSKNLFI